MEVGRIEAVKVTAKVQHVDIGYRTFLIQNLSDSPVYIKNKDAGSAALTEENGFAILPKTTLDKPLSCETLSIIGSGEADVRILYAE